MSALNYSTLTTALAQLYAPEIEKTFNRSIVLTQVLPVTPADTGWNVAWVAEFANGSARNATDGQAVSTYNADLKVPATIPFAIYDDAINIGGFAQDVAALTRNPLALAALFENELQNAITRIAKLINKDMWTGASTSPQSIAGLLAISGGLVTTTGSIGSTGTYATISRGTYADWASTVKLNGGVLRPLSFRLMQDAMDATYDACGFAPDLIICGTSQFSKFADLFGAFRQWHTVVNVSGREIKLQGGFQALEYNGIPVIRDTDCPAGAMVFLNSQKIEIKAVPQAPDPLAQSVGMMPLHGTPEMQLNTRATGLSVKINRLAKDGDSSKAQVITKLQLKNKSPHFHAVLGDLL